MADHTHHVVINVHFDYLQLGLLLLIAGALFVRARILLLLVV